VREQVHLVDGDGGDALERVVAVLLSEMLLLGVLHAAPVNTALRRYRPLFNQLDRRELGAFPEMNFSPNAKVTPEGYRMCHFQQASVAIDPATVSGGIICLRNSWTPEEIRRMTIEEFIGQDLPLARLLRRTILR